MINASAVSSRFQNKIEYVQRFATKEAADAADNDDEDGEDEEMSEEEAIARAIEMSMKENQPEKK